MWFVCLFSTHINLSTHCFYHRLRFLEKKNLVINKSPMKIFQSIKWLHTKLFIKTISKFHRKPPCKQFEEFLIKCANSKYWNFDKNQCGSYTFFHSGQFIHTYYISFEMCVNRSLLIWIQALTALTVVSRPSYGLVVYCVCFRINVRLCKRSETKLVNQATK